MTEAQARTMHDDAVQAARDAYAALVAAEAQQARAEAVAARERCAYCGSSPAYYERRGDLYLCHACGRMD